MASLLLNRLGQQVKKTGQEGGMLKSSLDPQVPHVAPGRLAGLRNKVSRFAEYTNLRGEVLSAPVTTEPSTPQTRCQKRKRYEKPDSTRKAATPRITRKRKSNHFNGLFFQSLSLPIIFFRSILEQTYFENSSS